MLFWSFRTAILAQTTAEVDTTSTGYQIGYQIGSYLPVAIIHHFGDYGDNTVVSFEQKGTVEKGSKELC